MASFVFAWMQIKKWKRNPRVICAFLVLLLLCLTMTSEYVDYSKEIGLSIQVFEPFILMFTQAIFTPVYHADSPSAVSRCPFY